MLKRLWHDYKSYIIALAALAAFVAVMWIFNIPCPIKYLTGISCAGCGMSRAIFSAFTLDLAAAFAYHPLWIVLPFAMVAIAVLSVKGKGRAASAVLYCLLALFVAVWIIRLILKDSTVSFAPDNGLISRAIKSIVDK